VLPDLGEELFPEIVVKHRVTVNLAPSSALPTLEPIVVEGSNHVLRVALY
jgi:hypothetical protein